MSPAAAVWLSGATIGQCHNARVTSETTKLRPWGGDRAPADWGLGDGQAIPWEYAPAPESRDIVSLKPRWGLFINGREVQASDGGVFPTVNPATAMTCATM